MLSKKLGIESRSTMDIGFLLRNLDLEEKNIRNIIDEICSIDCDDGVVLSFDGISPIREDDLYGGFNVLIKAQFDNIKDKISLDVAAGDPITPSDIVFEYKTLIEGESIKLRSYNYETILAEKIQAILSRGVLNSRCKDFYDVFIIVKTRRNEITLENVALAFRKTCEYRKTMFGKQDADEIVDSIANSQEMQKRWEAYSKRNAFASDIAFKEAILSLEEALNAIYYAQN